MNRIYFVVMVCLLCMAGLPNAAGAQSLGPDRVIDTKAAGVMQRLRTTTAFNGWIFAAYSTISGNNGGITIRKSTDSGQSWTTVDFYSINNVRYPAFDLVVTGNDVANLNLFLVGVNNSLTANTNILYVDRYNANTNVFLGSVLNVNNGAVPVLDIAIASDYLFPAFLATPYSVGIAWILGSAAGAGQIKFLVSTDAGATFNIANQQNVATATGLYRSLSLAYGRSASGSNGRYFIAWDEFAAAADRVGQLFTSRNTSTINDIFIAPIRLDNLTSATTNKCNTPKIAMQYDSIDNAASSVTGVVMANCEYSATAETNVMGFYNMRSHVATGTWSPLSVARVGTGNQKNAAVSYNSFNRIFDLTYLDELTPGLAYKSNEFNLAEPSGWTRGSSNYADITTGLTGTAPQVSNASGSGTTNFAWINKEASADTAYINVGSKSPALDVDDNGSVNAQTDGLLVTRYLLGFRGSALINNAVGPGAVRSTAPDIEAHLRSLAE